MKQADRSGAQRAVILADDGSAKIRDMRTGEERPLDTSDVAAEIERERGRPPSERAARAFAEPIPRHVVRRRPLGQRRLGGPGRGLGPSPPRPRRGRLRRPAGSHRAGPARLPSRRGRGRVRARPHAPRRGRDLRLRPGRPPLARDGQPRDGDRRVRGPRPLGGSALGRGHAAVRDRELLRRGGGGDAPSPPLPRPAARAAPARGRHAGSRLARDARVPRRRGLPGDRNSRPHSLDPGGCAGLPRARSPRGRIVLRASAVAAALQAAPDGRRLRALLPDRPLLPGRGSARRSPARLHPARHRDVVRRGRGRPGRERAADRARAGARGRPEARAAAPAHRLRRRDRPVRHRPPGSAIRARAPRPLRARSRRRSSRSSRARLVRAASSRESTPASARSRVRGSTG